LIECGRRASPCKYYRSVMILSKKQNLIGLGLIALPLLGAALSAIFLYSGGCGGFGVQDATCSRPQYFANEIFTWFFLAIPIYLGLAALGFIGVILLLIFRKVTQG
jgi:hypothetical protein